MCFKGTVGRAIGVIAMLAMTAPVLSQETSGTDEVFQLTTVIQVPASSTNTAGTFFSFDISWVDPVVNGGRYFLADRNNKAIDVINPSDLAAGVAQFPQAFAGFTGNNDTSGPDGVLTANNHTELWVGDSPGKLWILDASNPGNLITTNPATGKPITNPILINNPVTKGPSTTRADELCYDPKDNLIMIASPAENTNDANPNQSAPFVSFISTKGPDAYTVVGQLVFDGKSAPQASNGLEQCGWSPATGKFYQNVPEVNGAGNDTSPGAIAVINPKNMKVTQLFTIPLEDCAGPQGMAIGPNDQILEGCNAAGPNGSRNTVVVSAKNGSVLAVFQDLGGADEVWFNEGDGHYIIPSCNTACRTIPTSPFVITGPEVLGIVDANTLQRDQTVFVADQVPTVTTPVPPPNPRVIHSAAGDPNNKLIILPIPAVGGTAPHYSPSLCDKRGTAAAPVAVIGTPSTAVGCIAVLSATSNNDTSTVAQERGKNSHQE